MTTQKKLNPHQLSKYEDRRYYAQISAPFAHEPTRERIRIVHTLTMGDGLQSLVAIQQDDIVFRFAGTEVSERTLYSLQIEPGRYVDDPVVMGKVLHACDPNMVCDMQTLTFRARRPIHVGQLLSMDYESTEDVLFRRFRCSCGSPLCRGVIKGRLAV